MLLVHTRFVRPIVQILCVVSIIAKTILTHRLHSINCLKFLLIENSRKYFWINRIILKSFDFITNLLNIIIFHIVMQWMRKNIHFIMLHHFISCKCIDWGNFDCRHWDIWQLDWFLYNTFFFQIENNISYKQERESKEEHEMIH